MLRKPIHSTATVVVVALVVFGALSYSGFNGAGLPMGDLNLAYQDWMNEGKAFGISEDWVYPYLAIVPMIFADFVSPGSLIGPWLIGCALLFAGISGFIAWRLRARGVQAMLFWLTATALLGPVAISRLDTVSVALAVLGLYFLVRGSETGAAVWFSVATWVKVWPAALLAAMVTASRNRLLIFTVIFGANLAVLLVGFILGGDASLISFLTGQTGRGIQIEAPIAAFWLVPAAMGNHNFGIEYSFDMKTYEVFGGENALVANLMSLVQLGALAITVFLGVLAMKKNANPSSVFFWVSLTGTLDLIVFNKVGSPQYLTWLAVPMVYGILAGVPGIRKVGAAVLGLSAMTWVIYPVIYDAILQSEAWATAFLTLRNIALIALLVYANLRLQKLGKQRTNDLRLD